MFIQGSLQTVFDTLYELGVIDPVLKTSWEDAYEKIEKDPSVLSSVIEIVNSCPSDPFLLKQRLRSCDEVALQYLAMEVAREFADFYARTDLH